MMATTTPSLEALRLGAAQNGLHWFAAGTTLIVLEGRAQLEPPSRTQAPVRHTVDAGRAHMLETSGWWRLHSAGRSGVHLRVVPPAHPALQRTWLQMWQWLARSTQPRRVSRG
ncbi:MULTISPECIES: hypothetical protein [Ralstonia]|uniref:DUF2917 domain-containing protein n=1 Tax=Ralstonia mannitolilytica TaxID=105219 RepID=A0AAJ4ZJ85_9RALS|nr:MULTISPECIES: hypothetical protein [Ralstonia]CAG2151206.1 hypothetical protein LMG6866_04012 [Ralstonia mannitolilytica]CAJ0731074.1 hypothetical protein R77592_02547 [Ralstonia mannitolilytica]SUD86925.1 Uncharacterised protein [Ralstonia mannitolilytica]SUD92848.1 Uncharacterised protein [Ralstonia mannitolilytica]SUD96586.1 Uncharacterised protein [Ralstonia mannitolilytica]